MKKKFIYGGIVVVLLLVLGLLSFNSDFTKGFLKRDFSISKETYFKSESFTPEKTVEDVVQKYNEEMECHNCCLEKDSLTEKITLRNNYLNRLKERVEEIEQRREEVVILLLTGQRSITVVPGEESGCVPDDPNCTTYTYDHPWLFALCTLDGGFVGRWSIGSISDDSEVGTIITMHNMDFIVCENIEYEVVELDYQAIRNSESLFGDIDELENIDLSENTDFQMNIDDISIEQVDKAYQEFPDKFEYNTSFEFEQKVEIPDLSSPDLSECLLNCCDQVEELNGQLTAIENEIIEYETMIDNLKDELTDLVVLLLKQQAGISTYTGRFNELDLDDANMEDQGLPGYTRLCTEDGEFIYAYYTADLTDYPIGEILTYFGVDFVVCE